MEDCHDWETFSMFGNDNMSVVTWHVCRNCKFETSHIISSRPEDHQFQNPYQVVPTVEYRDPLHAPKVTNMTCKERTVWIVMES